MLTGHGGSEGALWLTDCGGGGKGRADRTPHGDEGEGGSGLLLPPQPQWPQLLPEPGEVC